MRPAALISCTGNRGCAVMPAGHDGGKTTAMGERLCMPKQPPPRKQPVRPIPVEAKKAGDRRSAKGSGGIFHIFEAAAAPIAPPAMPPQLMRAGSLKFMVPDINSDINSIKPVMYAPAIAQAMTKNRESVPNLPLNGGFLLKRRTIMKAAAMPSSNMRPYEVMNLSFPAIVNFKSMGYIITKKAVLQ